MTDELLYHYCCRHSASAIDASGGVLKGIIRWDKLDAMFTKQGQQGTGLHRRAPSIVWLTDLPFPDVDQLGLTRHTIRCDRTEVRYTVKRDATCITFEDFVKRYRPNPSWTSLLSGTPARWWVSLAPIPTIARDWVSELTFEMVAEPKIVVHRGPYVR